MNSPAQLPAVLSDAMSTLDRALANKTDPAQIERLYDLIDNIQMREAEKRFNFDFVAAQAEMEPISADATNPQTRSKYATYARLDRAIRPIYTAHGFGVTFTEEQSYDPSMRRIVGFLAHRDGFIRRYQIDVPREIKGLRGGDAMTPMHMVGSGMADFERQMATVYTFDQDEVWQKATREAQRVVQESQDTIAKRCKQLGMPSIPRRF